ncbi:MAG: LysR family transcriptional regulator [Kofleriaceae bacterium]
MLNYNHLHYFHVAAHEGSVARAAERLGVTQPTVSEQIRTLERWLGVTLFERLPTGLRLTEAGKMAFEHTSVMFRAGERLSEALGHAKRELPTTLRVGVSGAIARTATADLLMPLLALDNCLPTIRTGETIELLRDVRASELDLVLCESEPASAAKRGLDTTQVAATTLVAVAAPVTQAANDWSNVRLVQYRSTSGFRWEVEAFMDERGLRPIVAAEADDALFMLEAAVRPGNVAFVPLSIARDAITAKRLVALAELAPSQVGVWAIVQDGTAADLARRAVKALIDHARSR